MLVSTLMYHIRQQQRWCAMLHVHKAACRVWSLCKASTDQLMSHPPASQPHEETFFSWHLLLSFFLSRMKYCVWNFGSSLHTCAHFSMSPMIFGFAGIRKSISVHGEESLSKQESQLVGQQQLLFQPQPMGMWLVGCSRPIIVLPNTQPTAGFMDLLSLPCRYRVDTEELRLCVQTVWRPGKHAHDSRRL